MSKHFDRFLDAIGPAGGFVLGYLIGTVGFLLAATGIIAIMRAVA